MDYQYDYNMNLNNLSLNTTGKPNTMLNHPSNYNFNNINVSSSLNSNPNISTNFTVTNSSNLNKDYYREDNYGKNSVSGSYAASSTAKGTLNMQLIYIKFYTDVNILNTIFDLLFFLKFLIFWFLKQCII